MASNENKILPILLNALFNRNQDIIQKYLSEISRSNRAYYYIDNKVYCCIYEIAEKEGRADLAPKSDETLSEWRERADVPNEYLEIEVYLNNLFLNRQRDLFKQRKEYGKNKDRFAELPVTDVHLEPSKKVDYTPKIQSEPKPAKHETICMVIFILLIFVGPGILLACIIETGIPVVLGVLMIIIYYIFVVVFRFRAHEKGYMKFPTQEEIEEAKEARMRKWGGPIKSAHIIRLERGLYTGLGNRRPYPHGRRTKKY